MPNRLINETSPYLQQHAHNPVDWYTWGEEALSRAVREDKPILLSIGYSACHWCHVMERECFENTEIARIMNDNFVNIKVDREERPDLDAIYMEAVQAITGLTAKALKEAVAEGKRIKPVAVAERHEQDYRLAVGPAWLDASHPLAQLGAEQMGIVYYTDVCGAISAAIVEETPLPTAAAMLRDVIEIYL